MKARRPEMNLTMPAVIMSLQHVNFTKEYKTFFVFQKSRHHRLQEIHSSITQVPVTDDGILPLPTVKPGDEYVQESDEDVEDDGDDDDDEADDDDGDESDEEGEESAEVLEKQSECYL